MPELESNIYSASDRPRREKKTKSEKEKQLPIPLFLSHAKTYKQLYWLDAALDGNSAQDEKHRNYMVKIAERVCKNHFKRSLFGRGKQHPLVEEKTLSDLFTVTLLTQTLVNVVVKNSMYERTQAVYTGSSGDSLHLLSDSEMLERLERTSRKRQCHCCNKYKIRLKRLLEHDQPQLSRRQKLMEALKLDRFLRSRRLQGHIVVNIESTADNLCVYYINDPAHFHNPTRLQDGVVFPIAMTRVAGSNTSFQRAVVDMELLRKDPDLTGHINEIVEADFCFQKVYRSSKEDKDNAVDADSNKNITVDLEAADALYFSALVEFAKSTTKT